jgi:hypothetical protein
VRWIVGALCALSAAAYVRWSQELYHEIGDTRYARTLVGGFLRERGLSSIYLLRPVSGEGALLLLAFVVSCALAGIALRAAATPGHVRRRRGPELVIALLIAAIVPPLLMATVFWPDGAGRLESMPIITVTLVVALLAALVAWWRRRQVQAPPLAESEASSGDAPAGDANSVAAIAVQSETPDPGLRWAWLFLLLLVPLTLAVWWNGVDALRGFDTQSDHLPRAARWLYLARLSDESGALLTPYYPGNFLILVRWILVLGTDAYAFVPSFAAAVLCLWTLYAISRDMGQRRWTAVISAATAASCALVPYLSTTVQADTATTACLLLGVLLLLRWVRTTNRRAVSEPPLTEQAMLLSFGASLGLAVGIKYSALPPALALFAIAAGHAWRASYQTSPAGQPYFNLRTLTVSLATIAAPALLCGGYWLLRNAVLHGNPFYPVATAGLPGVDMRVIIPIKRALVDAPWHRATYPWAQWDFGYVYDDGLGACFAAVALVGAVLVPFRKPRANSSRRLVWAITLATYALWIMTGSITARFGLLPILLSFTFVGELWQEFETPLLKLVTLGTFALSVLTTTWSLVVGAVYTSVLPPGRRGVPAVVDTLPAARIFNATSASNRYRLLGRDHRHEVITGFRAPRPGDVARSHALFVLLDQRQVPVYTAALPLTLVARGGATGADTLSLWRVGRPVLLPASVPAVVPAPVPPLPAPASSGSRPDSLP